MSRDERRRFNDLEENVKLTQPTELVVVLQLVLETVDLPFQFAKSERWRRVQGFLMLAKLPFQGRHTSLESPQHFRLDHPRRGRMRSDDLEKGETHSLQPRVPTFLSSSVHRVYRNCTELFFL